MVVFLEEKQKADEFFDYWSKHLPADSALEECSLWQQRPKGQGCPIRLIVHPPGWPVLVASLHFSASALTVVWLLRLPDAFTAPLPGGSLPQSTCLPDAI
jgi:hypothetical protein